MTTLLASVAPALADLPVPRDLALPLPLDESVLRVGIVLLFLLHILFVNLMVGGSVLTVLFEIVGLELPRYDRLARVVASTVTVNKSLAVVLGVGPLLLMNLLYTSQFYAANALTGHAWLLLVPLVSAAFLLTYLHKYTWDRWTGPRKTRHLLVGLAAALLFLGIPLIFLTNINLMLFPQTWSEVSGFFSSLRVGNVFPRYFHFLCASLAVTGLFLAAWTGRARFPVERLLPGFTRAGLTRHFYRWTFFVSCAQFLFGPFLLFTLPAAGITPAMLSIVIGAALVALLMLLLLWIEIRSADFAIGRLFWLITGLFAIVVLGMGQGRHLYREASLAPHKALIARRTEEFRAVELATQMRLAAGLGAGDALTAAPTGRAIFTRTCGLCHAKDTAIAAPSLVEIAGLYTGNAAGVVAWAKAPSKKRPAYPPMPSFAHLGDEQLALVAAYMLEAGARE